VERDAEALQRVQRLVELRSKLHELRLKAKDIEDRSVSYGRFGIARTKTV